MTWTYQNTNNGAHNVQAVSDFPKDPRLDKDDTCVCVCAYMSNTVLH